jgi:hypothetical protein
MWSVGAAQVRVMNLPVSLMLSPRTSMIRALGIAVIPLIAVLQAIGVASAPSGTLPMPAVSGAVRGATPEIGVMPGNRPVTPGQGAGST